MFEDKLQRKAVDLAFTQSHERVISDPSFKNLNLSCVPPGGSTQLPQVPQVFGQDSLTPTKPQR